MKRRKKETSGIELSTICRQLKLAAAAVDLSAFCRFVIPAMAKQPAGAAQTRR